jgi:Protein of unknown function (DUF4239)
MTMYWIYDLPNWLFGLLTILVFNAIAIGGLIATRPVARRLLKESGEYNDVVSWFFAAVGVFYGLAVGLIAVATWEDFTAVDGVIGKEAASLAGLYRDFDGYPPDLRSKFEGQLRDYAKQIVAVEWPKHRQGLAPDDGGEQLDALENDIMAFEPKLEREKITHAQVLHGLDDVIEVRRARMQAVGTGLPAALWAVVLIGALLNFALVYLFWIENRALHVVLIALFATFVALLIFLTAAMDNPFRGEFSVSPDAIKDVINSVMKPAK